MENTILTYFYNIEVLSAPETQRYHRAPYVSFGTRRRPQIVIIGNSVGDGTWPDCQRIVA